MIEITDPDEIYDLILHWGSRNMWKSKINTELKVKQNKSSTEKEYAFLKNICDELPDLNLKKKKKEKY